MGTESEHLKELDLLVETAIADAKQAAQELLEERLANNDLRYTLTQLQAELGRVKFENRTLIERAEAEGMEVTMHPADFTCPACGTKPGLHRLHPAK